MQRTNYKNDRTSLSSSSSLFAITASMSSVNPGTLHRVPHYSTPPTLILFTLAIVVTCFAGFTVVYFCRCCLQNLLHTRAFHRAPSGPIIRLSPNNNSVSSPFTGLDSSLLQSFPTFPYSTVRKKKKHAIECAICLVEFEEECVLRLITVCCHMFHKDCIDLWLQSHKTCPVCRTDLNHVEEKAGHVSIDVKEGVVEVEDSERNSGSGRERRFSRSHSTGHSVVMVRDGGGEEENNVGLRRHKYTKSWSSYKDIMGAAGFVAPCRNCGFVQTAFATSSNSAIQNVH